MTIDIGISRYTHSEKECNIKHVLKSNTLSHTAESGLSFHVFLIFSVGSCTLQKRRISLEWSSSRSLHQKARQQEESQGVAQSLARLTPDLRVKERRHKLQKNRRRRREKRKKQFERKKKETQRKGGQRSSSYEHESDNRRQRIGTA